MWSIRYWNIGRIFNQGDQLSKRNGNDWWGSMALMHDDVILCVAYTSGRGLVVMIPKKIWKTQLQLLSKISSLAKEQFVSWDNEFQAERCKIDQQKKLAFTTKPRFHVHVTSSCIRAIVIANRMCRRSPDLSRASKKCRPDSWKICDNVTDFRRLGPIFVAQKTLQGEKEMADKRKKLSTEKEAELLISEWVKHPCLYQKSSSDYHDRNKQLRKRGSLKTSTMWHTMGKTIKGWFSPVVRVAAFFMFISVQRFWNVFLGFRTKRQRFFHCQWSDSPWIARSPSWNMHRSVGSTAELFTHTNEVGPTIT